MSFHFVNMSLHRFFHFSGISIGTVPHVRRRADAFENGSRRLSSLPCSMTLPVSETPFRLPCLDEDRIE
jgi:hypothetical protein